MSLRFKLLLLSLCFAVLFGLSCRPSTPQHQHIHSRWMDSEPSELFAAQQILGEEIIFNLDFSQPNITESWKGLGQWTPDGPRFSGENNRIVGEVDLEASNLREFIVFATLPRVGPRVLELAWAAPGEAFDKERLLRLRTDKKGENAEVRIVVDEHPNWRGRIGRLRLIIEAPGDAILQSLIGHSSLLATDQLPQILNKPWKVDVADDVRNAYLTAPGLEIHQSIHVPEGGKLRASYAHLLRSNVPVSYQVVLNQGNQLEVLFQDTLEPSEMPMTGWRPVLIDLAPWAGNEVKLTLKTTVEPEHHELRGLPVWEGPEIVAPLAKVPLNVVLISIDTLRADRMSLYGHERPTTPNISAWAERSAVVFQNPISPAPWTLPSHTSMLTGLSTFRHGVNQAKPVPSSLKLLPEYLREHGFRTFAVTGGGFLDPSYKLSQGFDRFRYWSGVDRQTGFKLEPDREIELNLRRALGWLDETASEPFFLFFHTYDIHHRVSGREPFFSRFSDLKVRSKLRFAPTLWLPGHKKSRFYVLRKDDGDVRLPDEFAALPGDIYDSRIANMDRLLQDLFSRLDTLGLTDRTLVVLTSDHGEMLGEHGVYDHHSLYEENLKVPLVIAAPGLDRHAPTVEQQVRTIDITPTILDLLDIPPEPGLEGHSLRELMETGRENLRRPAWSYAARSNYGLSLRLENRVKLIYNNTAWSAINGDIDHYQLDDDPREETSIDDPDEAQRLLQPLIDKYLLEIPGIRMSFRNPGSQSREVTITSAITRTKTTAKSVNGPDCDCVHWNDRSATVKIPPAADFTLIFEHANFQTARMSFSTTGGHEVLLEPERDLTEGPVILEWTEAGWQVTTKGADSSASIQVRWEGKKDLAGDGDLPEESNEALRERLKALGYI